MHSRNGIADLSIAFLREEVNYDVVGDYFACGDFGIIPAACTEGTTVP